MALAFYGIFLFLTNSKVAVFEDEASIIAAAHRNPGELVSPFLSGTAAFHHPPLSEILLHFWLKWTGDSFAALRIPSIFFYCLSLCIVAETAHLLWGKRWTAVTLGVAWPVGYFLGRPAGWYSLTMLGVAGLGWFYFRWRASGRLIHLAGVSGCAILLVYTNHFGWAFLAVLTMDLWWTGADRRRMRHFLAAVGLVALASLPLVQELFGKLQMEMSPPGRPLPAIARASYMAHSLLASEMAAPWTWPGVVAAACGLGLLWLGVKQQEPRRALLWLAVPLAIGLGTGIVSGVRLILFGPWLLLFLTSTVGFTSGRFATALAALAFAMGWLGTATGYYQGTHRYSEPWPQVTRQVVKLSGPGDVIVCDHSSFYLYVSHLLPFDAVHRVPAVPVIVGGRTLAGLAAWRAAAGRGGQLIYLRTTLMPWALSDEKEFLEYASRSFHLVEDLRFDRDRSAALKNYWFPELSQPEWRMQIQVWTPLRKP